VRQTRWQPPGLESPVLITQARVRWDAAELRLEAMTGSLGATPFSGSYRRRLAAAERAEGPDTGQIRVPVLELSQLDGWLNPRRQESRWAILRRALGKTPARTASWLAAARIEGVLAVEELRVGHWTFHDLRAKVSWGGETLALKELKAAMGTGVLSGTVQAKFSGAAPWYRLEANASALDLKTLAASAGLPANFRSGTLNGHVAVAATGRTAAELQAALRANGTFEGRSITLANLERRDETGHPNGPLEVRLLHGNFEWGPEGLELTGVRLALGQEIYEGRGSIGRRAKILFEMASDGKPLRLVEAGPEATATVVP
jgi:uncharacterized protein involved in outer membrane biogenesis